MQPRGHMSNVGVTLQDRHTFNIDLTPEQFAVQQIISI